MDKRLKELLPYMKRLRHLHQLSPEHVKCIDESSNVVAFIRKDERAGLTVTGEAWKSNSPD